ncbi:hypothetical protein ACFV9E_06345 [Streptomyces sp. NPDC059835]|uniref:hypothetical protein n=1 Tax=Streptomyces sp. NPDC059835 TaxID=3346967 RepID=UPI003669013E
MLDLRDWVRLHNEEAARLQQVADDCDGPLAEHYARQYRELAVEHQAEADALRAERDA